MHIYDETVERIMSENEVRDAREWLAQGGKDYSVIHELSHDESVDVVEECHRRGALHVDVIGTSLDKVKNSSVDMLLIALPEDAADRKLLFDLEAIVANETGFEPSIDEGQKYILLRWT